MLLTKSYCPNSLLLYLNYTLPRRGVTPQSFQWECAARTLKPLQSQGGDFTSFPDLSEKLIPLIKITTRL